VLTTLCQHGKNKKEIPEKGISASLEAKIEVFWASEIQRASHIDT
jgi:hypothetical protein